MEVLFAALSQCLCKDILIRYSWYCEPHCQYFGTKYTVGLLTNLYNPNMVLLVFSGSSLSSLFLCLPVRIEYWCELVDSICLASLSLREASMGL